MAVLDSTMYPHLWGLIASHASHESLLKLRTLNRANRTLADRILFKHVSVRRPRPREAQRNQHMFALPVYAYSLATGVPRRLPFPALLREDDTIMAHAGWEHTRILDIDTPGRSDQHVGGLRRVPPSVEVLRMREESDIFYSAPTVVDEILLPDPRLPDGYVPCMLESRKCVTKHVYVFRYDPEWENLNEPYCLEHFLDSRQGHEVLIFRPREGEEAYRRMRQSSPALNWTTFLSKPLRRAADRCRAKFTFVGLEEIPPHVLGNQLGLDDNVLALASDKDAWAEAIRTHTLQYIQNEAAAGAQNDWWRTYFKLPAVDYNQPVEEYAEVLTVAEYRARVGEEAWVLESLADKDE